MDPIRNRPVRSVWHYDFALPLADYRAEPAAVRRPYAVDLIGVDGRWTGGLRRHPGFRHLMTIPGIDPHENVSGCSWGFDDGFQRTGVVDFFKYAEIQRYPLGLRLRGFVVRIGMQVTFHYYDEYLGEWDSYVLDENSGGSIDVTFGDRFLWLVSDRQYGRSVYWQDGEFRQTIFGQDTYTPNLPYVQMIQPAVHDDALLVPSADNSFRFTIGYRLIDTRRGLHTPLRTRLVWGEGLAYRVFIEGHMDLSAITEELGEYNGIEIFRTINLGGVLYRCIRVTVPEITGNPDATLADWVYPEDNTRIPFVLGAAEARAARYQLSSIHSDTTLVMQPTYDVVEEPTVDSPFFSRIYYADGVNFAVTGSESTTRRMGDIRYSPLTEFAPERFPGTNYYSIPRTSDEPLTFKRAGDFLFALAPTRLFRIAQTGASVSFERLSHGWGLVNRYAAAEVGTDVAFLGDSTLVMVNGSDGELQTVGAVERLLTDPNEWSGKMANVFMAFDAVSNALYIVNPDTEDALVIWGNTNAVTRLEDMTFTAATSGPHPEEGGRDRAFFITPHGRIVYPDSNRDNTIRSQLGLTGTISGTLTSAMTDTIGLVDAAASFETFLMDGYVYFLSGNLKGNRYKIGGIYDETTILLQEKITAEKGDRYTLCPIPFEVVGPMLWTSIYTNDQEEGADLATRRKLLTVGYSLRTDETLPPSACMQLRGYSDPAGTPDNEIWKSITTNPDDSFGFVNLAGPVLFPSVRCIEPDLDFVLRSMIVQAEVCGTMVSTR